MKIQNKILSLIVAVCLNIVVLNIYSSNLPNIVTIVNDETITAQEFLDRKHIFFALNNNKIDPSIYKKIDLMIINNLISEKLLKQNYKGREVSEAQITDAIVNIENTNNMKSGEFIKMLKSKNVNIESFKEQLESEIIKNNIVSSLYRSVKVSPSEIKYLILSTNSKNAKISMLQFTSNDNSKKSYNQMIKLGKNLCNCKNIDKLHFNKFATIQNIDTTLHQLSGKLFAIAQDLEIEEKTSIYKDNDVFKLAIMCDKEILNMSKNDNEYIINFITNIKLSKQIKQYLETIRKKAYVKIFI